MVTKILISCSKIDNEEEKRIFANAMNIEQLNSALTKYALLGDATELLDNANQVRELLEMLYIE